MRVPIDMPKTRIFQEALRKAFPGLDCKIVTPGAMPPEVQQVQQLLMGNNYYAVIFSHAFAKAFWKDEPNVNVCKLPTPQVGEPDHRHLGHCFYAGWAWHLQQMVLCEEPLEYLAKFLKVEGDGEEQGKNIKIAGAEEDKP